MKSVTALVAIIPILAGQAAVIPQEKAAAMRTPVEGSVYIVTRATGAESRALFSARLLKLSAAKIHWYEDASVVRAEVPKKSLAALRADRDVVLVLSEHDRAAQAAAAQPSPLTRVSLFEESPAPDAPPPAPAPKPAPIVIEAPPPLAPPAATMLAQQAACAPPPMNSQFPAMPGVGAPTGMPMGMGMGMGLMDSLAGGVASRLLNRAPSCKISVARNTARFLAEGGDGMIEVNASGSCGWQAQSSVPWIKITSGSGVSGSGVVTYTILRGEGRARSGSVSIVANASGSPIKGKASQVVTQTK